VPSKFTGSRPTIRVVTNRNVDELVAVATGAEHRHDPIGARTGGPAGNAQLTAWTGLLLLVLFIVECVTLLSLGRMITWHIVLGTALVPFALLKTATTGWRIARYYTGNDDYRRAGPPPLVLRALGPLVVLTALAVLGTGLALVALGDASRSAITTIAGQRIDAVAIHKAAFVAWLVVVGLHALLRLVSSWQLARGAVRGRAGLPGRRARLGVLAVALGASVVAGLLVIGPSHTWNHQRFGDDGVSAAPDD
jgi:hypothetical protein